MSVIQQIQEKYAKLMAVIIALALVIFVIMLAFENGGNLFAGFRSNDVGKVNGESIDRLEFEDKITQAEAYLKQQNYLQGAAVRQQAIDMAWNQEVNRLLITSELDKLGMQIGKKELGDILYGPDAPADLKQQFTDPNTQVFNAQLAKTQIDAMIKKGTPEQRAQINAYISNLELTRLNEKYGALLTNSVNVPRWLVEKQNADNSQIANISFVRQNYSDFVDSTIKVGDKEIQDYVNKHKNDFKQVESRSIAYVSFSALPTAADTADALNQIMQLKPEMDTTTDAASLIARNASSIEFSNEYYSKKQLQEANQQMGMAYKDTIFSLPKNGVYGPYLDGSSYVIAKLLDSRVLPDSIKCRHILISTDVQQGGVPDSVGKMKIDSIEAAIAGGASWADMVEKYNPASDGSRRFQGEMTFTGGQVVSENFAPEFAQFILSGRPGERKKVKTSFGWHYIEVMKVLPPTTFYKVAYMGKKIEVSQETDNNANNEATLFASSSRDMKSFDASVEKLKAQGINKAIATDITPAASNIQGLGVSRPFVRTIYEAKKGEVLQPEKIGDSWVVAIVTEVNEKGTQSAAKARPYVEPLLVNQKKAEKIAAKIGTISTLEAASAALGGKPIERADSIRMANNGGAQALGFEPKVIGAAFNPANKGKVVPAAIPGNSAVFVVKVESVGTTPLVDANVDEQRKAQAQQQRMRSGYYTQGLMDAANIKDNRAKLF